MRDSFLMKVFRSVKTISVAIGQNLYEWKWSVGFLFWIIISAGTFSELAFLLSSMWKSADASDHSFVLLFMSESTSVNVGYFASSAYVLLPVCILPLAAIKTIRHLSTWIYCKKFLHSSGIWFLLYGLPTIMFLIVDVFIISNSETKNYVLPDLLVRLRADMAYLYGIVAIVYHFIGKTQEVDRLKEKDGFISQLVEQARVLTEQVQGLTTELGQQKTILLAHSFRQVR
jgi:hypothetical protein